MLIDWFTVIAQIINFLILVWLLKRFLYQPILNAIDAREKLIAAKITDADAKKAEAQKERDEYQHKNEVFDQQRNAHMNEVIETAKKERAQLLDVARQESDDLSARLQQALRNEQHSLNEELSRRAREEVFAIARKTLSDLADTSLEQRMTDIFLTHLRELNAEQIDELKSVFATSSESLRIRTAFELTAQQRAAIETAIAEFLGEKKPVAFEIVPDLVSGIELSSDGQKIAWSIADYLASLAKSVDDLLKIKTESRVEAGYTAAVDMAADAAQDVEKNGD
jgi:F-type H+-transporting ATPase subunit b